MELLHQRCAGLDVHKDSVTACVRLAQSGEAETHLQAFQTTTKGLLELSDWLGGYGVTHVALEATGVYWKPVWYVLEGEFELVLANAAHVKNVPGRKTDVKDAVWLSDLLAHGLVHSSFVPPQEIQEIRDLTRTRKQFVREISQHSLRLQKTFESANIKLGSVVSDVLGTTGRLIIHALIDGVTDPHELANLARGRLRSKQAELAEALQGRVRDHHRFLFKLHIETIDALEQQLHEIDERLGGALKPFRAQVELLKTIPGISDLVAQIIISEIGVDMSRFPTAGHLISWAGLCPGHDESAGKKRSSRLRKGAPWLKATLTQAAWSAVRTRSKDCYLKSQYMRLKARRGPKKAIMAVSASMMTAAYHMLKTGVVYEDLGADYFDKRNSTKMANRLVQRLQRLGFDVELKAAA